MDERRYLLTYRGHEESRVLGTVQGLRQAAGVARRALSEYGTPRREGRSYLRAEWDPCWTVGDYSVIGELLGAS